MIRQILESWRSQFKRMPYDDMEGRTAIMATLKSAIQDENREATEEEREAILEMVDEIEVCIERWQSRYQGEIPIAFREPSLEQTIVLNAWAPHMLDGFDGVQHPDLDPSPEGYRSLANFSANRIGKTWTMVIDVLLWVLPNDPNWKMFQWMTDWKGRGRYRVLRRPDYERWVRKQKLYYSDVDPPKGACEMWVGVGRAEDWDNKLWLEFKKWMPPRYFGKRADGFAAVYKHERRFETAFGHNIVGMSMSAETETWSGKAAWMVAMDEGVTRDIMDEALTRIQGGGRFHWAFTPVEPANIGEKTKVAKQHYDKPHEFPLVGHAKFFIRFKLEDAPPWIVPEQKKQDDLRRFRAMGAKGKPRMEGGFFNTSPNVFSNFDHSRNVLPWTGAELRKRFPDAIIYRGFDEGTANPSACVWFLLTRHNEWIAFMEWEEAGLSVSDRCIRVLELSGNERLCVKMSDHEELRRYRETFKEGGMDVRRTFGDSKMFKRNPERVEDDWTETYHKQGLKLERATIIGPKARCDYINDLLRADETRRHVTYNDERFGSSDAALGPGCRFYVSKDCTKIIERLENYLFQQIASGPNKGSFSGEPENKDDHMVDSFCYPPCSKLRWHDRSVANTQHFTQPPSTSRITGY